MWRSVITRVFSNGWYTLLTLLIFFISVSLVLLLPNYSLIEKIAASEAISSGAKLALVWSLYGSLSVNFTLFSAFYTLVVLLLFAVNIALFVYYIRRAQKATTGMKSAHAGSLAGITAGILGIGCAACGSVILAALAASVGATGILIALPLHGGELALVGIALLVWSIRHLVKKISDPLVCRI